jgi:hypothetical protein
MTTTKLVAADLNLIQDLNHLNKEVVADAIIDHDHPLTAEARNMTDIENTEATEADQERKEELMAEEALPVEVQSTMVKKLQDKLQKKEEL